jgi:adenylate cyclase
MGMEIEHKFLVTGNSYRQDATRRCEIKQGFLSRDPERTVRVRVKDDKGYITIKGLANESGVSRYEWEKEIPVKDAEELMLLCEPGIIDKTRYLVPAGAHTIEVDVFHGDNEGLVLAEVELPDEGSPIERPQWLGEEVTGDSRYYNNELLTHTFNTWI